MFIFFGRYYARPATRVSTTTTRVSTTNSNGVVTSVQTNSFTTTLRRRYGYNAVTTSTTVTNSTTVGNVWQAPPTVNNPAPSQTPVVQQGLRNRTGNSAMAYVQPAVPRTTTSTTITTTTTVTRPIAPRFRLVPIGWGRWVWRRY
jgi:hypothetical protein